MKSFLNPIQLQFSAPLIFKGLLMGLALLLFVTSCGQKPTPSPKTKAVDYKNLVGTWKFKEISGDSPEAKYYQEYSHEIYLFYPDKKAEIKTDDENKPVYDKGTVKENADKTAFIFTIRGTSLYILRPTDDANVYTMEFKNPETGQLLKLPLIRINNSQKKP